MALDDDNESIRGLSAAFDAGADAERRVSSPELRTVNGRERLLLPDAWKDATPSGPQPAALGVYTLQAVLDYISSNIDRLTTADLVLHVFSPIRVRLLGPLDSDRVRPTYLEAVAEPSAFRFGEFYDPERFVIALQTGFVATAARDELVRVVATIDENSVRQSNDDGVSQEVVTRAGVTLKERAKLPSPVTLQPFRTFMEVDQPASPFVLRARAGADAPTLALFEADGGRWKLEAVESIAAWLENNQQGTDKVAVLG